MELVLKDLKLRMRHPFTISLGTTTVQHNLMVELRQGDFVGYGEGAGTHGYADFSADSMRRALESVRDVVEDFDFSEPESLWERVAPALNGNRFALCALDEAAHDLWGKMQGKPVWELWGLDLDDLPVSNYTIGIDSIEKMVVKMKEFDG
jgi:L-Ala-D/L-Glu epimerase